MSSKIDFVEYVCDQGRGAGFISYKRMFGEFGIYCDGLIFGLVCDDQFFIKETKQGHDFYPQGELAAPYTGSKPYILIENVDDSDFLCEMIQITCRNLPIPKEKKPRSKTK